MQTKGIENSSHLLSDAQSVRVWAFAKSVLGGRRIPARTLVRAIHSASHAQAYKMVQGEQFWSWSAAKELFQWAESIGYLNCYNEHYNVTFNTLWQTQMDNTLSSPPCYHPLPEDQCWVPKCHAANAFAKRLAKLERGAAAVTSLSFCWDPVLLDSELADLRFKRTLANHPDYPRGLIEMRKLRRLRRQSITQPSSGGPGTRRFIVPHYLLQGLTGAGRYGHDYPFSARATIVGLMDWVDRGFIELTIVDNQPFDRWEEELEEDFYHVQIDDQFSFQASWGPELLISRAGVGPSLPRHRFYKLFEFEGSKVCHSPDRVSTCRFLERFLAPQPESVPITDNTPASREQRVQSYLESVKRELAQIE